MSWGECDLLKVEKSGYLTEFEIKTSVADLQREWKKKRWTNSFYFDKFRKTIRRYFIVLPKAIAEKAALLPLWPTCSGSGRRSAGLIASTSTSSVRPSVATLSCCRAPRARPRTFCRACFFQVHVGHFASLTLGGGSMLVSQSMITPMSADAEWRQSLRIRPPAFRLENHACAP